MGPPVKSWNETSNSPDDDDSTSHSLSLTSSLDKTGGRSSPCIADKSKTLNKVSSPCNNNTMKLPPTDFTSSFTSPDKNNTTIFPPSVEANIQRLRQKYGIKPVLTFCNGTHFLNKSPSQPPIFSSDITTGQLVWGSYDDDSDTDSYNFYSSAL